jgi:hypothetical protein
MTIHGPITRAEYDALPGINWSALKCGLGKTRAHIDAAKHGRKDSTALRFGRAFHCRCLQVEKWGEWETVSTKTTTNPNAVTEAERDSIDAMCSSINQMRLPVPSMVECAMTWEYGGVHCKAMIDGMWERMLGDLKSTKDASPQVFGSEIIKYKYHGQLAWYMEGLQRNGIEVHGAQIIAVEKTDPYASACHVIGGSWLDLGRKCFEDALEVYADNRVACYGIAELELPDWMESDDEFTEDEDGISLGGSK